MEGVGRRLSELQSIGVIVAIVTGIGGFALSVIVYFGNCKDRQPRISVTVDIGTALGGEQSFTLLSVTGVNTGLRTVRIEEVGLYLPDGRKFAFYLPTPAYSDPLPCQLSEGQKCVQHIPPAKVARAIQEAGYGTGVKLIGYMRDARSVHFKSKSIIFDPTTWL